MDDTSQTSSSLLGVVALTDLAMAEFEGENLLDRALAVVTAACSRAVVVAPDDPDSSVRELVSSADRVLVHDLRCPTTSASFLRAVADMRAPALAAVSELTDTVKTTSGDQIGRTVDRDRLRILASPIVADSDLLLGVPDLLGALAEPAVLVARLRAVAPVTLVPAPRDAYRVSDRGELRVLSMRGRA